MAKLRRKTEGRETGMVFCYRNCLHFIRPPTCGGRCSCWAMMRYHFQVSVLGIRKDGGCNGCKGAIIERVSRKEKGS